MAISEGGWRPGFGTHDTSSDPLFRHAKRANLVRFLGLDEYPDLYDVIPVSTLAQGVFVKPDKTLDEPIVEE